MKLLRGLRWSGVRRSGVFMVAQNLGVAEQTRAAEARVWGVCGGEMRCRGG